MRRHRRIKKEREKEYLNIEDIMKRFNLKWQKPVITEKTFYQQNKYDIKCLGFPWAEVIDRNFNLKILENIFKGHTYTCCQHIYFRKLIPFFKKIGIKELYTPHKIIDEDLIDGIKIKACPLYAINIEDKERNSDFVDQDLLNRERKYLFSFRGGYNDKYMSDIRKRIFNIEEKEDIIIQNSGGWHFEEAVYGNDNSIKKDKITYNQLLLNSKFMLCPSGSGPSSIRFWECLGAGCVPILLSDEVDLPYHKDWEKAIVRIKEKDLDRVEEIVRGLDCLKMRKKCLEVYNFFKDRYKEKENYDSIVHYCCGCYERGDYGGVARYDYQINKALGRTFFQGPQEKGRLLKYLKTKNNPLIITDNHLSCDISNNHMVLLVHHGCARTTAERNPDWGEPWKSLCVNGQDKMLKYRNKNRTKIISISEACSDDFKKYYGDEYEKFERIKILHPSELDESKYKKTFNDSPLVLGNWSHVKKGQKLIEPLKREMKNYKFEQLNVRIENNDIKKFNEKKQEIYLRADMFLQIANSEGNSYATLDALLCGLVIISSNVGLFYKDVPEDCFIKLDWKKNKDINYVKEKIEEGWRRRNELSRRCRKWYMENCRFIHWEKKMQKLCCNDHS